MEEYPCPTCPSVFSNVDDLYNHTLQFHSPQELTKTLEKHMQLTKHDFVQVDSHWVYVVGGFHLSLAPDEEGKFKLTVYGSIADIPTATQYPSEPEWERAIQLANKFVDAYNTARRDNAN